MKLRFRQMVVNDVYLTKQDKEDAYFNARYAAVSYIPPLSFFLLVSPRSKSKFVHFHAKQAFVIFLMMLIGIVLPGWFKWGVEAIAWALTLTGFYFAATGRFFAIPGIIQLLSFHIEKDSPIVKKVRSARAAEMNKNEQ
jgi:uncharacterized membrane protein